MPIDPGLGGYTPTRPVPVDPILIGQQQYTPPVSQPITETATDYGIDIGAATAYRGYYYEIVQNLDGNWLWAVYIGTRVSWGLAGTLIGGGTSNTQAEAMEQVTTIIDNLASDADYVAPAIQEDATIGGEPILPTFELYEQDFVDPDYAPVTGNGNGGNGNGNGALAAPDFALVGLVAVLGALWLFFVRE